MTTDTKTTVELDEDDLRLIEMYREINSPEQNMFGTAPALDGIASTIGLRVIERWLRSGV